MFLELGAVPLSKDDNMLLGGDDSSHVGAMIRNLDWMKPWSRYSKYLSRNQSISILVGGLKPAEKYESQLG